MVFTIECEYLSQRGKSAIIVDGYKFTEFRSLKEGDVTFRCSNRKCRVSLSVDRNISRVLTVKNEHNHESKEIEDVELEKLCSVLKRKAVDDISCKPNKLIRMELQSSPSSSSSLPHRNFNRIRKTIYSARRKARINMKGAESSGDLTDLSALEEPLIDYPGSENVVVKEEPQDGMEEALDQRQTTCGVQTNDDLQVAGFALHPPDLRSLDDFKPVILHDSTTTVDPLAVPLRTTVIKTEPTDDHLPLSPSESRENDEEDVRMVESCEEAEADEFVEQPPPGSNDDFINRLHFPTSETYSVRGTTRDDKNVLKYQQWPCTWCKKLSVVKKTMYRCAACPEKPGLCVKCFIPFHINEKNFRTN